MEVTLDHQGRLRQEMRDAARPFREHYEQVIAELAKKEREIIELRETRESLAKLLKLADPDYFAEQGLTYKGGPKPGQLAKAAQNGGKKKSGGGDAYNSMESPKVQAMADWFQNHAEELNALNGGVGFYASQLAIENFPEIPMKQQSAISKVARVLHQNGILALSRVGDTGGRKYYKVVV